MIRVKLTLMTGFSQSKGCKAAEVTPFRAALEIKFMCSYIETQTLKACVWWSQCVWTPCMTALFLKLWIQANANLVSVDFDIDVCIYNYRLHWKPELIFPLYMLFRCFYTALAWIPSECVRWCCFTVWIATDAVLRGRGCSLFVEELECFSCWALV